MAERTRLIIDTDDVVRRAVKLRLLKLPTGTSLSDLVSGILREALAEELRQLEEMGQGGEPGAPKRKRGRPRKGE